MEFQFQEQDKILEDNFANNAKDKQKSPMTTKIFDKKVFLCNLLILKNIPKKLTTAYLAQSTTYVILLNLL